MTWDNFPYKLDPSSFKEMMQHNVNLDIVNLALIGRSSFDGDGNVPVVVAPDGEMFWLLVPYKGNVDGAHKSFGLEHCPTVWRCRFRDMPSSKSALAW